MLARRVKRLGPRLVGLALLAVATVLGGWPGFGSRVFGRTVLVGTNLNRTPAPDYRLTDERVRAASLAVATP